MRCCQAGFFIPRESCHAVRASLGCQIPCRERFRIRSCEDANLYPGSLSKNRKFLCSHLPIKCPGKYRAGSIQNVAKKQGLGILDEASCSSERISGRIPTTGPESWPMRHAGLFLDSAIHPILYDFFGLGCRALQLIQMRERKCAYKYVVLCFLGLVYASHREILFISPKAGFTSCLLLYRMAGYGIKGKIKILLS